MLLCVVDVVFVVVFIEGFVVVAVVIVVAPILLRQNLRHDDPHLRLEIRILASPCSRRRRRCCRDHPEIRNNHKII